jgi:diguanylate cyclase (GGDEF)-like protein/PAS domain S-box-containing protein
LGKFAGSNAKLVGHRRVPAAPTVGAHPAAFPLRILILEDAPADAELMIHELRKAGWAVQWHRVHTKDSFIAKLGPPPEVILADYAVPGFGAVQALELLHARGLSVPLIVVTGSLPDEAAVECMKLGAADYLLKDRLARLPQAIVQALEKARERAEQERADRALRQSERLKDAIIKSSLDCLISIDQQETILELNPAGEQTFRYKRADVLGKPMPDLIVPPRLRAAHRRGFAHLLATGECPILGRRVEMAAVRSDGTEFPIELSITAAGSSEAPIFTAHIRDISERRSAENNIRRLNRVYAVLSGINSLIIRVKDRQLLFNEACRIAMEHGNFGIATIGLFDPQTLKVSPVAWAGIDAEVAVNMNSSADPETPLGQGTIGRSIRERRPVFSNDMAVEPGVGSKRHDAIKRGYRSVIALPLMPEGAVVGVFTLFAKESNFFNDEEVKLLADLAGDVSFALENIAKAEQVSYLAYFDVLTGLPNRALFHERLAHQLRLAEQKGTSAAVILVDVKRLRHINESLGRHTGDALLRDIAGRFKTIWPDPDNVARIASDLFGGLLVEVRNVEDVAQFLEGPVTKVLSESFSIEGTEQSVSVVCGVALFPADGKDAESLFRSAEATLNKAKKAGERYLFYQPAMNARVAESLLLQSKLRRALDAGQFTLHCQPKIELASGQISGLEGLMRWNDPQTGLVPPAQFIPILEDTGMILEVGQWALSHALQAHEAWNAQGLQPPRVAVNVSAVQVRQKNFVDVVRRAIEGCNTTPHALDLEITESLIMEDIEVNIEKLRAIRGMGVNIAIDDFGTGYSSLGYLAKLPVNAVKIDRSFIMTMAESADSMSIVSTIISLAHSLKLKVIAEGVETEEQSRLLKLLKCDEIQGYLISRPLPPAEIADFIQRTRSPTQNIPATTPATPLESGA